MRFIRHKQPQVERIHRSGTQMIVPGGTRNFETGETLPAEVLTFEVGFIYQFEDAANRELEQQH